MTSRAVTAAAATQPGVAAAANAVVTRGNAVDAVCAAVLMAAALEPGVWLGPVHFLVTGPGFGLRCVDGRVRQPGRGAPRPRGFLTTAEVPIAARVAVPALPAAVATALSMFGTVPLRRATEPALDVLARNHPRRNVLAAFAREGAASLAKQAFHDVIMDSTGRFAGGQLTRDDLLGVRAPVTACAVHERMAVASWETPSSAATCQAVCVADRRGGVAAACYEIAEGGLTLEALGLVAPLHAEPVMRGKRRRDVGSPISGASTIALVDAAGHGLFDAAIGLLGRSVQGENVLDEGTLEGGLRKRAPAIGVARGGKTTRAYSFTP
jgi:hypothetical protein